MTPNPARWLQRLWCGVAGALILNGTVGSRNAHAGGDQPKDSGTLPPPYTFNLGGLTSDQIKTLKEVPGVEETVLEKNRARVVWQPFNEGPWGRREKWVKNAEKLYDLLAIKGPLGKTRWTHGGLSSGGAGTIMFRTWGEVTFGMMFDDGTTGHNEVMSLYCFSAASPGQVEHEMLRDVAGTNAKIEKCGDGYVIVSHGGRGTFVVWQVSDQMFVRIDNSYDKEMVAAHINRLGSITPESYMVSVDQWVKDEIVWRLQLLDGRYGRRFEHHYPTSVLWGCSADVGTCFPQSNAAAGVLKKDSPLDVEWQYLYRLRRWLWANRSNFKYDDGTRGYLLKGPDLYDSKNPPELPDEIKDPPKPAETTPAPTTTPPPPAQPAPRGRRRGA